MRIEAVVFDLGGVVLDSPLAAFAAYERAAGLAENTINQLIVSGGPTGAWSQLERGELVMAAFFEAFEAEARATGIALDAAALMQRVADGTAIRPRAVAAIRRLRGAGFRTAAVTNNWLSDDQLEKMDALRTDFDAFIESARVGMRKPDPRIYRLACDGLGCHPSQVAFLDDLGGNLKAARALGMATIKVVSFEQAFSELGELLQLELLA